METFTINRGRSDFSAVRSKSEHRSGDVHDSTLSIEAEDFGRNVQNVDVRKINKTVDVTAWYFKNRQRKLTGYPKRIELDRQEYNFADGLRFFVRRGKQAVQLFDMTDGNSNFRLRFDSNNQIWTLVSISQAI